MVKNCKKRQPEGTSERLLGTYRNETAFALCPMDRRQYKRDKFIAATATEGCKDGESSQIVPPLDSFSD